jgi:hypothetical protein
MQPCGRSSLMKYLDMTRRSYLEFNFYAHTCGYEIKNHLRNDFIPEENTLDSKVRVPVLRKCLRLMWEHGF